MTWLECPSPNMLSIPRPASPGPVGRMSHILDVCQLTLGNTFSGMQEIKGDVPARRLHQIDTGATSSLSTVQPQPSGLGSIQAHDTGRALTAHCAVPVYHAQVSGHTCKSKHDTACTLRLREHGYLHKVRCRLKCSACFLPRLL